GHGRVRRDPAADRAGSGARARRARPLFRQPPADVYASFQPDRPAGAVTVQWFRRGRAAAVVADRWPPFRRGDGAAHWPRLRARHTLARAPAASVTRALTRLTLCWR